MGCCFYETYSSWVAVWEKAALAEGYWEGKAPLQDSRTKRERLAGRARVDLVHLVCSVCLVCLVYLIEPDRLNRPNELDRLADFFSILIKQNGPPLCGTPKLPSEQGDVQQSFSRSRPIAPRLHLPMGSI